MRHEKRLRQKKRRYTLVELGHEGGNNKNDAYWEMCINCVIKIIKTGINVKTDYKTN